MRSLTRSLLASCLVLGASTTAFAQTEAQAIALLASSRRDDVKAGLETLGLSATPAAVNAIADRVRRGLDAELLDLALTTLRVQNRPEAGAVLIDTTDVPVAEVVARVMALVEARLAPAAD